MMIGKRPSFWSGPATCASRGENGLPSMEPVAPGTGWVDAGGALSVAAVADAVGAGALAAVSVVGVAAVEAGDDDADEPCSSDDVSEDSVAAGFWEPPQA